MTSTESPTPYRFVTVQRGDDRPIVFPPSTPDDDLSGAQVLARAWRDEHRDSPLLHTWSTTAGTATAGPDGVELLVDDSRSWPWERCYFEVEVEDSAGTTVEAFGVMVVQGRPE